MGCVYQFATQAPKDSGWKADEGPKISLRTSLVRCIYKDCLQSQLHYMHYKLHFHKCELLALYISIR